MGSSLDLLKARHVKRLILLILFRLTVLIKGCEHLISEGEKIANCFFFWSIFPIGATFPVLDPSNPSNRESPMNDMPVIVEGVRSKDERDYTGLKNKRDTLASENVRKTNPSALQSIPLPLFLRI
ncbi:hypothetical protein TNIN_465741 [Trichonephila inaurata madagascariensis]|uniref:Uncharacterized protein n=1 Tax=Trichonephila inaurata madagascariensis TaxID=2747483 RepID=A0A8X6IEU9_9ARAC|nr:hypothetical protein TNIN_465741 [Trichonephila inaurata madagascariensis]